MATASPDGTRVQGVVDEHSAEHAGVRRMLAELCSARDGAEMARLLDAVDQLLAPHFAHEEASGGIFDTLVLNDPGLHGTVRTFRKDHRRFMTELADLRVAVRIDAAAARPRVLALCQELSGHEAAENEAVADALYSDLGTSG